MFERLTDKRIRPDEDSILGYVGTAREWWLRLCGLIKEDPRMAVETKFFTKEHGWSERFYIGSRTFCRLFPEAGAFSLLVVLGEAEAMRVEGARARIEPRVYDVFRSTERLRDGRWLWVRVLDEPDMESCAAILEAKAGGGHA